jgi:RHS repeat-associated protein
MNGSPETLSGCASTLTRTLWDGDQVLYEFRTDGTSSATTAQLENDNMQGTYFDIVSYVHGVGLDAPLAALTGKAEFLPIAAWHGQFDTGLCGVEICTSVQLSLPQRGAFGPFHAVDSPFYGTLITGQQDGSGYLYRRNRYLDPAAGRFTQEDPIGLAGGLNLHGYAEGDPVNSSDPFGLCPNCAEGDNGVRVREGFWNRIRNGNYESCDAGDNAECRPTPVELGMPSYIGGPAGNAVQGARLARHLEQVEKYGEAGVRVLENGAIRYYGSIRGAAKEGEMIGRRLVRERNPVTDVSRTWHETLDAAGNVRIVRPQTVGEKLHYFFDALGTYIGRR